MTVITVEKVYIPLLVILVSFFAFNEPFIRRNAIRATKKIVTSVPIPDLTLVKESEVIRQIRIEITIDGVQKNVEYLSDTLISELSF